MTTPRPHIRSHTAMRGIAALIVVFYHLRFGADVLLAFEEATRLFERGYLWVDFFFLLSGFVLTYVYGDMAWNTDRLRRFYVARLARVYPLHAATLALLVAYQIAAVGLHAAVPAVDLRPGQPWSAIPAHLLLVQAWGFAPSTSWNIPAWSISAELFAYLLFPLFASALAASKRAFLLLACGFAAAFYAWIGATTGSLDITVGLALARCVAGFVLGMAICAVSGAAAGLPSRALGAAQIAALAVIAWLIQGADNDALLIAPFAVLVLATAQDRGVVARGLSGGALQRMGELSYSIYLLHVPLKMILGAFWVRLVPLIGLEAEVARAAFIVLVLAATVTCAHYTYALIEVPARRALTARFGAKRRVLAPAP